jgi:hypothetical protein
MLFVDSAHQRGRRRKHLVDKDEDSLLRCELYSLPDDVDKLPDCEIRWYQIFFLVDGGDICPIGLFADDLGGRRGLVATAGWVGAQGD